MSHSVHCRQADDRKLFRLAARSANTQTYVLDDDLQPVPIGVVGELYIGGAGLGARLSGPAGLTAERFVPIPFGDGRAAVPDRGSGALARRWELEYLGRIDHQVKIRGYRIELGEIEATLREQPACVKERLWSRARMRPATSGWWRMWLRLVRQPWMRASCGCI